MSKCQETAGFLISAACGDSATQRCHQCKKPICERHSRIDPNGNANWNCIACHRKSSTSYGQSNDDPYLYSGSHHPEYYTYAAAGTVGLGAAAAAHASQPWQERSAFNASTDSTDSEDWTDQGWEDDFDGS